MRRNIAIECYVVVEMSVSVAINRCDCISILRIYDRDKVFFQFERMSLLALSRFS